MPEFECTICSRSFDVHQTALDKYPGWERKGWKRKGNPLANLDLIRELLALYRQHRNCKLEWIAAHSGYRWNEYADSLASAWRRDEL